MHRLSKAVLVASLVCLAGCGPQDENQDGIADGVREPDSVSLVAPSTPKGSVSGQVLDTRLQPLPDATVSLNVGVPGEGEVRRATTDAAGQFAFTQVPAGAQVLVTMGKEGYATARTQVTVPGAAGNFPINDGNAIAGPYALTQLNGTVKLLVVTTDGRPAKGAHAVVEASPAAVRVGEYGNYGSNVGVVVVDATADDTGVLTITGIPSPEELSRLNGRYNISISPIDGNGDGIYDSAGSFQSFTATSLMLDPSPRLVELPSARSSGSFGLLATNVPSLSWSGSPLENLVKPGESIYLVFSQAIAQGSVLAQLTDEAGAAQLGVAVTIGQTGNVVQLQPSVALEAGREYNLSVRATSADSGDFWQSRGYLFGGDPAAALGPGLKSIEYKDAAPADGLLNPYETVYVNFTTPLGLATGAGGLKAFINYDLNQSGTIGDVAGETGNKNGFAVISDEPNGLPDGQFPLKLSDYTSRFHFTYYGSVAVPPQITVRIAFSQLNSSWGEYQTVWGQPVLEDLSAGITVQPEP